MKKLRKLRNWKLILLFSKMMPHCITLWNRLDWGGFQVDIFQFHLDHFLLVMFVSYILFFSYYYFNRLLIPRMCNISSLMVMNMFVYEPGAGCKGVPSEEQDENGEDLHLSRLQSNFSRIQCIPFSAVSSVHVG